MLARLEQGSVEHRLVRVRRERNHVCPGQRLGHGVGRNGVVLGAERLEPRARRGVDPHLLEDANLAEPLDLRACLPARADDGGDARVRASEAVGRKGARRADAHALQVPVVEDRERDERRLVEEQHQADIPPARRGRQLVATPVVLATSGRRRS